MRAAWLFIILAAVVRVVAAQQPPGGRAVAEYSDVTSGAKALADAARLKAIMPTHALDDEEVLRVVKAPFGPERATFAEHQYSGAGGADHVRSLGFTWEKGVLHS